MSEHRGSWHRAVVHRGNSAGAVHRGSDGDPRTLFEELKGRGRAALCAEGDGDSILVV